MSREVHVRFCEGLGLKCPGLLTKEPGTWDIATYHKLVLSPQFKFVMDTKLLGFLRSNMVIYLNRW